MRNKMHYSLKPNYVVRKEFFGGLLFNLFTGKIRKLNKTAFIILDAIHQKKDPYFLLCKFYHKNDPRKIASDAENIINSMLNEGILQEARSECPTGKVYNLPALGDNCFCMPRSVFWEAADVCNLGKCIHCYSNQRIINNMYDAKNNNLYFTRTFSFADQIVDSGVFTLDIGGGEPLMNPYLITLINKLNHNLIRCNIASNLFFDHSTIENFVTGINWQCNTLQVSLDGPKEIHNRIRACSEAFDKTLNNILFLIQKSVPVSVNCTVMSINIEYIDDFLNYLIEIGVPSVRFVRLIPSGIGNKSKLLLSPKDYRRLCNRLYDYTVNDRFRSIKIKVDDHFMFLEPQFTAKQSKLSWLSSPPYYGCGAGRTLCAVNFNGDLFPCSYISQPEYCAGNIYKDTLNHLWRESKALHSFRNITSLCDSCMGCKFVNICLGGCRACAIGYSNDMLGMDNGCWRDCI